MTSMSTSTNSLLEQGIQEVVRLSGRITTLSEQEAAFTGVANELHVLCDNLIRVQSELERLNCEREMKKWRMVWIILGGLGALQLATLLVLLFKA